MFEFLEHHPGMLFVGATLLPMLSFVLILLSFAIKTYFRKSPEGSTGEAIFKLFGGPVPGPIPAYIATGAMIEAKAMHLDIPRDLSIAGFDDTDMSAHLDPPLTTIHVPSRRMGEAIGDYIISLLDHGTATPPSALDAELIIRGSTASPRVAG